MTDHTLFNEEAERAFLGAMLTSPYQIAEIELTPDDFFIHRNRWVWEAMQELVQTGMPVDNVTVAEELESKRRLKQIGGPAYLVNLLTGMPTSIHAKGYADIIRDKSRRRQLRDLAHDLVRAADKQDSDLDVEIPRFFDRLIDTARSKEGAVHINRFLSELYDEIDERAKEPKDIWGIPTGFADFDRITGGLHQGESLLISGKPGVGKSIFAVQMGFQMASNMPGVIYSLEMVGKAVTRRVVSAGARIETRKIKTGHLEGDDWTDIVAEVARLERLPLYMSDSSAWTTASLRADLARLKAQAGIGWFVVDYLYLLNDARGLDDTERTAHISKGIKQICKDLSMAGIAVHSITKAGMTGVPSMADLRGSGQVSFDADLITFLTGYVETESVVVPSPNQDNVRILWIGKGRELEVPQKYMHFQMRKTPDAKHNLPAFIELERRLP